MIPDDLIERAARAMFEADQTPARTPHWEQMRWEQLVAEVRQGYQDRVKAALAVVLPAHRALAAQQIERVLFDKALCNEGTLHDSLSGAIVVVREWAKGQASG